MGVELSKISAIYSKGNIFKFGVEYTRDREMCVFNGKLAISRKQ